MRYVDSNIFISNLIGDKRKGKAAEKYLELAASGKESTATSVHTMIEIYAFLKGKKLTEHRISEILIAINLHGVTMLTFEPEIMTCMRRIFPFYFGRKSVFVSSFF